MRVLSIDWDYFVRATLATRMTYFPDGGEYPKSIEDVVWAGHYDKPELVKIGVNKKAVEYFKNLLHNQKRAKVFVANSHKHCFTVLDKFANLYKTDIEIINVDFHHDVYNFSNNLDCGNWLRLFLQKYKNTKAKWLCQPTSDRKDMPIQLRKISMEDVRGNFDIIFICKSGLWSPPHLDSYFEDLLSACKNICYLESIENRYNEEFKAGVEQIVNLKRSVMENGYK